MAAHKKYRILGLLLLLLALLGGGLLYHYRTIPPPRSLSVVSASGKQIEILRSQDPQAAKLPNNSLEVHDRLLTHDFGADILYNDGSHLHLGPLTEIQIERDAKGGQRLILIMGAMRLETAARALGMIIGTPFGVIHLHAGEVTVLDISVSQGAFVRLGEVDIERNQTRVKVPAGYQFTIDGLVLPLNPSDGLTLQEVVLDLTKPRGIHRNAQALAPLPLLLFPKAGTQYAPQTRDFAPAHDPQALAQNDRVRTQGPGAYILVNTWGRYLLDETTDILITRNGQNKRRHEAMVDMGLARGGFTVLAPTHDAANFTTSVDLGGQTLQLSSGLILAQAHILKRDSGGRVKLRFGRLLVGERSIEAGSVVVLSGDNVFEEPLTPAHVDITTDMTSIVHYPSQVPTINFVWSPTPTLKSMNIEISPKPAFLDVPFAETIKRGSFMLDQLASNRVYYWRVGGAEAAVHQLQLESDTPDCKSCIPPDVVSDAVPHTVIEYDETVARVAFEWRPFAGAKYYLFRMYNDGQFESPVVASHADQPNYLLPSTHLNAGVYYWNAIAYDDQGRLLHKGAMSDFEIQEPDQVPPLIIDVPQDNAVVPQAVLTTKGQTRHRAKLWCNGVAIAVNLDGRFQAAIPLRHGSNFLVYTVEVNKRMQHLYTRQVLRPGP